MKKQNPTGPSQPSTILVEEIVVETVAETVEETEEEISETDEFGPRKFAFNFQR